MGERRAVEAAKAKMIAGEAEFRWRGGAATRVEALSDLVFAFALTLLVVSSTPPSSFSELTDLLWGFPGFALAFTMLLLIWGAHYVFFRRYALMDARTVALNAALLFLILFFIYPLKYLATMFSAFVRSVAEGAPAAPFTVAEAQQALVLMSVAYAGVFLLFTALYAHALSRAEALGLDPRERALTRFSTIEQLIHVVVAAVACALALALPVMWAPYAGFLFFLIGPAIFIAGAVLVPSALVREPASQD